ncbi:hypothetical protein IU459_35695 [Nocardia amamiensis]|uniref:Uncharacterized protein n=1 Tax=Nocardia amamiensis TaxID=404578 RepID=A0ABS0D6T5_9NOCA|nr:hypothetical protein [Nocardia amamiensis]MBF6302833.1 hypothetical protein [Nocardia amamiensis]
MIDTAARTVSGFSLTLQQLVGAAREDEPINTFIANAAVDHRLGEGIICAGLCPGGFVEVAVIPD